MAWSGEIVLACGHGWPGDAKDEADARQFLALCMATGDSARCPACGTQQTITGPLRRAFHYETAHDGQCESEFLNPPGADTPCGCAERQAAKA